MALAERSSAATSVVQYTNDAAVTPSMALLAAHSPSAMRLSSWGHNGGSFLFRLLLEQSCCHGQLSPDLSVAGDKTMQVSAGSISRPWQRSMN
jgi:hypothetical protein